MVTSFRLPDADSPPHSGEERRKLFHFPFSAIGKCLQRRAQTCAPLASGVHLYVASSPPGKFVENETNRMRIVFGGFMVLRRRLLLSLVVALSLSTLASANSTTVDMTFLYPGTNASGGYYTYPYYFSINGGTATAMMCDSFNNHISVGRAGTPTSAGCFPAKACLAKKSWTTKRPASFLWV